MATEQELQQIAQQRIPRRTFGSRISEATQREVIEQRNQARQLLEQIAEQRRQEQIRQQEQARQQQGSNRVQTAVNEYFSSRKRKLGSSFRDLTTEERQQVEAIISSSESSFERSGKFADVSTANFIKNQAVRQVEQQLNQSLNPEQRRQVEQQALAGRSNIILNTQTGQYSAPITRADQIPIGTPIGTGARGGLIVVTGRGQEEQFQTRTRPEINRPIAPQYTRADTPQYTQTTYTPTKTDLLILNSPEALKNFARGKTAEASRRRLDQYYQLRDRLIATDFNNKISRNLNLETTPSNNLRQYSQEFATKRNIEYSRYVADTLALPYLTILGIPSGLNRIYNRQDILTGGSEILTSAITLGQVSKSILRTPVELKVLNPETQSRTGRVANVITQDGKSMQEDLFAIQSFTPRRERFTVPFSQYSSRRIGEAIGLYKPTRKSVLSIEELKIIFPEGNYEFIPARSSIIVSPDKILSVEGKTLNNPKLIEYSTREFSAKEIALGRTKTERQTFKVYDFYSESGKDISEELKNIRNAVDKKLLKDLGRIDKDDFVSLGEVATRQTVKNDLLKYEPIDVSRVASKSKIISKIEFERDFGLKSKEFLLEEISSIPASKIQNINSKLLREYSTRKQIKSLSGLGIINYYELPSNKEAIIFLVKSNNQKLVKTPRSQITDLQKQITKQVLEKQNRIPSFTKQTNEALRINQLPLIVGGGGASQSLYTGTGQYELTTQQSIRNINRQSNINLQPLSFKTLNEQKTFQINNNVLRNINREINRSINREVNRNLNREVTREITREITRQIQRPIQRTISRTIQRTPPPPPPPNEIILRLRNPKPVRRTDIDINLNRILGGRSKFEKGFRAFVLDKGKRIYVSDALPRTEAILRGVKETTTGRKSLLATFGIEETRQRVRVNNVNRQVNIANLFRQYRIRRGKNIYIPNLFIQRRNQRLSTETERRQIQIARQLKKLNG